MSLLLFERSGTSIGSIGEVSPKDVQRGPDRNDRHLDR
jgi:hypothetical protein